MYDRGYSFALCSSNSEEDQLRILKEKQEGAKKAGLKVASSRCNLIWNKQKYANVDVNNPIIEDRLLSDDAKSTVKIKIVKFGSNQDNGKINARKALLRSLRSNLSNVLFLTMRSIKAGKNLRIIGQAKLEGYHAYHVTEGSPLILGVILVTARESTSCQKEY